MSRLIVLLALAFAPLLAAAHEGRHAPGNDAGASKAAANANGTILGIAQAAPRCPGGRDLCCCHDATGTSAFQPVAIDAPFARRPAPPVSAAPSFARAHEAPRIPALARYSPRGPPPAPDPVSQHP